MKRIYCLFVVVLGVQVHVVSPMTKSEESTGSRPETKKVTTASSDGPFSYEHKIEVAHNKGPAYALDEKIEAFAHKRYQHLNESVFFNTDIVRDPGKVRKYLAQQKHYPRNMGQIGHVMSDDGMRVHYTFFDRGSDRLLVIAPGFTNPREKMAPFLALFPDYDIVLFDFRGHGYKNPGRFGHGNGGNSKRCGYNILEWVPDVNVDAKLVTLGKEEHFDVHAVIKEFSSKKRYAHVYGLGVCYGAFVLLKTAALYDGVFEKIVVDGSWLSGPCFVEKVRKDLKLMLDPQAGGWQKHWFWSRKTTVNLLEFFLFRCAGLTRYDEPLTNFLPKILKTEVLLFHGKNDLTISRSEFETIWHAIPAKKTAIITSNPHVRNHIKQKELYALICDFFFMLDQSRFMDSLRNNRELQAHMRGQFEASCAVS